MKIGKSLIFWLAAIVLLTAIANMTGQGTPARSAGSELPVFRVYESGGKQQDCRSDGFRPGRIRNLYRRRQVLHLYAV